MIKVEIREQKLIIAGVCIFLQYVLDFPLYPTVKCFLTHSAFCHWTEVNLIRSKNTSLCSGKRG